MVIGSITCKFELYIINNSEFSDYDIGEKLEETGILNNYDSFDDVVEIANDIALVLYKEHHGEYRFILNVLMTHTRDYDYYSGAYEYDMDYSFEIISKEEVNYFSNK